MRGADSKRYWWQSRGFAVFAILLAGLPLLWPTVPPLIDVPGHMGAYRVMLGTDAATLSQWYHFDWRLVGYLGGEITVSALAPLFGLELATKAMMIAIPMLTVAGLLWLSREVHGRVQPHALFALPFAYHIALQYGFVNYSLAMALMLNALALWIRLGRQERLQLRAGLFVPLSIAIWLAHLFGWLVLGLLALCAELARQRGRGANWRDAIWRSGLYCLPLALPFAMFVFWRPGGTEATSDYWQSVMFKPGWVAMLLVDRWRAFDIASVALSVCILYFGLRSRLFTVAPALASGAASLLAIFLILPFGSAYIDARILPFAVMLGLISVGVRPDAAMRRPAMLALAGLVFCLVRLAAGTASMAIEGGDWDRRLAAVDHLPHGARVAAFVTNKCRQDWRMERLNHLQSMAIVRKSAFTNDQYDLGPTTTLSVIASGITGFAMDPTQMVTAVPCSSTPGTRTLAQALALLPRDKFDYVWLISPGPVPRARLEGMIPVWASQDDRLFRLVRQGLDPKRLSATVPAP